MTVVDNIQLPPTLLSRFDLIYLLLDKVDQTRDRKLANHLVAMHFAVPPAAASQASLLSQSELTDYISYARTHVQPVLTDAAADQLVEGYVDMRRLGGHKKVITATPRQLESLIRLAEALARMRLSSTVQTDDVHEALRLMKSAMKQSCTDPKTGMIDMDSVQTGKTAHDRFMEAQLAEGVKSILVRVRALAPVAYRGMHA
jgi:DNA replication licensing factor MCM4